MASTISASRQYLYGLLFDHSWPVNAAGEKPQVTFGAPVGHEEQEVVALGGVDVPTEEEVALGGGRTEERYVLLVEIKVYDPAGEASDVDARGWELADEVRSLVRDDLTFGGAVRYALPSALVSDGAVPARDDDGRASGGWVIFLTVRIACAQRIT